MFSSNMDWIREQVLCAKILHRTSFTAPPFVLLLKLSRHFASHRESRFDDAPVQVLLDEPLLIEFIIVVHVSSQNLCGSGVSDDQASGFLIAVPSALRSVECFSHPWFS